MTMERGNFEQLILCLVLKFAHSPDEMYVYTEREKILLFPTLIIKAAMNQLK